MSRTRPAILAGRLQCSPLPRSLDSVGIAGFSHDFGSLEGKHSAVADVFDRMGHIKPSPITAAAIFFGNTFPFLWRIPTPMRRLQIQLNRSMEEIATVLLENTRREMQGTGEKGREDKSIIGLLSECRGTPCRSPWPGIFARGV